MNNIFQGPIKPTKSFSKPPTNNNVAKETNWGDKYAPKSWNDYFDSMEYLENVKFIVNFRVHQFFLLDQRVRCLFVCMELAIQV